MHEDEKDTPLRKPPPFAHGTFDAYFEVFDPFVENELVIGSLTEDLGDILRRPIRGARAPPTRPPR